jgi:LysM repeat protein
VPVPQHRKDRKFRRAGRHAAPSQLEAVAQKAGKAVPAAAVVGALALATQADSSPGSAYSAPAVSQVIQSPLDAAVRPAHLASAAGLASAASLASAVAPAHRGHTHKARPGRHAAAARAYTVRPGDTLAGIAFRFYGSARAWSWLYQVNRAEIANPNLILPGQVLRVPPHVPASFRAMHADAELAGAQNPQPAGAGGPAGSQPTPTSAPQGTLGCSGLETLWRTAGGAPSVEATAASVAIAESGGHQYATGTYGERGYWQINPIHGSLSTYDAYGNARAAVIISDDGSNWSPWTTFVDGAYAGQC